MGTTSDYGMSPSGNERENKRVRETVASLETPCAYEKWVVLDAWTIPQAVCIISGVEPDVVLGIIKLYWFKRDHKILIDGDHDIFSECVRLSAKIERMFLQFQGSYLAGKLQIIGPWLEAETLIAPSVAITWAVSKGYAIPPELAHISTVTSDPNQTEHSDEPDNPLDYGRLLDAKGYQPSERIARLKKRFPNLTTAQLGAYARGFEPSENSKAANKKWYQDNKPK